MSMSIRLMIFWHEKKALLYTQIVYFFSLLSRVPWTCDIFFDNLFVHRKRSKIHRRKVAKTLSSDDINLDCKYTKSNYTRGGCTIYISDKVMKLLYIFKSVIFFSLTACGLSRAFFSLLWHEKLCRHSRRLFTMFRRARFMLLPCNCIRKLFKRFVTGMEPRARIA